MMVIVETELDGDPRCPIVVERADDGEYEVGVADLFRYSNLTPGGVFLSLGNHLCHGGSDRSILIRREGPSYDIHVNGVVRHPKCTPEDVMRALGNYLMSPNFSLTCDGC